jgi:acetyltransferase-like isoleucine patch superfamily enzyme
MRKLRLIVLFAIDQLRAALFRARWRHQLRVEPPVSPNLRLARMRIEPGGSVEIGSGLATERQGGNQIWVQAGGTLCLGRDVWLRTEHGENHITVFPGARIEVGPRALLNGAMLHAKREIRIGADARLGFGVRVIDADLHPLDSQTPERVEPVRIGDRVWLGANVLVLRGVCIGDDVVVGAAAVVTRDLPSGVLAVGSPARPVRELASRAGCG